MTLKKIKINKPVIILILFLIMCILFLLWKSNDNFTDYVPKIYICLLSVKPSELTYNYLKEINEKTKYPIVIVIDDDNYDIPNYIDDGKIKIVKIDHNECEKAGYKGSVLYFKDKAVSRDKALYYFNKENIDYDYVWFIEEDVFIPDVYTIQNLDLKYQNADLLSSGNEIFTEKKNDWHWNHIYSQTNLNPPYARCMICAIRCSKKLLKVIDEYAKKNNNLFLDEALFNTLSLKNNLEIKVLPELILHWYNIEWKVKEMNKKTLYHPIKSIEKQEEYRKYIQENSEN